MDIEFFGARVNVPELSCLGARTGEPGYSPVPLSSVSKKLFAVEPFLAWNLPHKPNCPQTYSGFPDSAYSAHSVLAL